MVELIFITYILLSGVLIKLLHRDSRSEWLLKWLIVSTLPVVGWLFPIMLPKRWAQANSQKIESDLFGEKEESDLYQVDTHTMVEVDKELDVVSIEEALIVSEYAARRQVMISVLKQDSMKYMDILQKAVSNEDTETSHYAVSAVMELKRKLTLSLAELSLKYETNKEDAYTVRAYADVLHLYMQSGFLDERTIRKIKLTYILVLKQLIGIQREDEAAYRQKVDAELQVGELFEAEKTALLYMDRYPYGEGAYLHLIKVYFHMNSYGKLQEVLRALKESPLSLSNHGLTLVRFWSEGA